MLAKVVALEWVKWWVDHKVVEIEDLMSQEIQDTQGPLKLNPHNHSQQALEVEASSHSKVKVVRLETDIQETKYEP